MKKIISIPITAAALLLGAGKAYTYGPDGHYLVGAVADQMLAGTTTATKIKALIGNVSLATASTLPDEIKSWDPNVDKSRKPFRVTSNSKLNADLKAFLEANQMKASCSSELLHHVYHFTDIQVFDPPSYSEGQVGASTNDIVHMIPFCTDVLTGKQPADNPKKITRRVALVLLVHYVGDLHQPLHVGAEYFSQAGQPANPNSTTFAGDKGGNSFAFELLNLADDHMTSPGNLHHYWDNNAVKIAMRDWAAQIDPSRPTKVTRDQMATLLKNSLPGGWTAEPTINPATFAVDCANEILPIAQDAHKRLSFSSVIATTGGACPQVVTSGNAIALPVADYPSFAGTVVADEIHKAGHRLADLLRQVLK